MTVLSRLFGLTVGPLLAGALVIGCAEAPAPKATSGKAPQKSAGSPKSEKTKGIATAANEPAESTAPRRKFKPVQLTGGGTTAAEASDEPKVESVMEALKPLQVLLGQWNGTSRTASLDSPEWVWDLQTDPKQPALVVASEKGKYVREGRMTFVTETQKFALDVKDGDGVKRHFVGDFTQPVEDVAGDDKKLQRTYKLEFVEEPPATSDETWRLTLSQQENNRYLLEVSRKRGSGNFLRVDTVNTQREGTSFALSDSDFGEKTCIISQGLGTMSVSFEGRSYWVCCTGCKAAFEEDPKKWIAKFEERQKKESMTN